MATTWYLGPAGDLRALFCPERDIDVTELRFGGVHQSLGGARTMDVTGIKKQYQFSWNYLDAEDYKWLRALHTRLIAGPHRMIDPLLKNRLSLGATNCDLNPHKNAPYTADGGFLTNQADYPDDVLGQVSVRWSDLAVLDRLTFDLNKGTDVFPGETITHSLYLKGASAVDVDVFVSWFDKDSVFLSHSASSIHSVTTSWDRYSGTVTAPADAVIGVLTIDSTATTTINIAAPQLESGAVMTDWEQGGANPMVLIDQLSTVSPRYPVTNVTMTLLEV